MRVQDVVEEIIEKIPENTLPVTSILRKVTQVRDQLLRNSTGAQRQSDVVCTAIDLKKGQSLYDLPCPPGNVTDVDVQRKGFDIGMGYLWH